MKDKWMVLAVIVRMLFSCSDGPMEQKNCCKNEDSLKIHAPVVDSGSIFLLKGTWTDQNGKMLELSDLRGKAQLVSMIFTSCSYACPRIVADIKDIEQKLSEVEKEKMDYLLISFDTERDTPAKLKAFEREMNLNKHWRLLRGSEEQVRELSLLLDVKYEKQTDGSFAHSNVITILNSAGVRIYRQEGLGVDNNEAVEVIGSLIK